MGLPCAPSWILWGTARLMTNSSLSSHVRPIPGGAPLLRVRQTTEFLPGLEEGLSWRAMATRHFEEVDPTSRL